MRILATVVGRYSARPLRLRANTLLYTVACPRVGRVGFVSFRVEGDGTSARGAPSPRATVVVAAIPPPSLSCVDRSRLCCAVPLGEPRVRLHARPPVR
eukprot:4556483-Prymnesium_polylepis.2